jgi:hypothetical protein
MRAPRNYRKNLRKSIASTLPSQQLSECQLKAEEILLRRRMTEILDICKETMVEDERTEVASTLYVIDQFGQVQCSDLSQMPPDLQYKEVRTQCKKHKPKLAVYIINGARTTVDCPDIVAGALLEDNRFCRRDYDALIGQARNCTDLSQKIAIKRSVEVEYELRRCTYLYGATKHARLSFSATHTFTEDDPKSALFDETVETDYKTVTRSGDNVVETNSWFEGVEWSDLVDDGFSDVDPVNPYTN